MKRMNAIALAGALACAFAHAADVGPQAASRHTAQANRAFGAQLPLADQADFEAASRGLLATLPAGTRIADAQGKVVWDTARYDFMKGAAPDSVNPSLWRQEQLNNIHGLFKVTEGVYQLRGYDVSNMTLIAGKTGWIVVDPLTTSEVAKAAFALAQEKLGARPVSAVIFTHGHADHFGGVNGIVPAADAAKVRVIVPDGFMESALAENVLAGNVMTRRAQYQFGMTMPTGERGAVGVGLGKAVAGGTIGILPPTDVVTKSGQELDVDGVRMVFHMANGSEAPAEFMFYLPELKALCLSEVVSSTMHNIYTLRGAKVRDALAWSKYVNQLLDAFPQAEIAFRSHHWPVWGQGKVQHHLAQQRDMYRFIHDRAMGMANQGATMSDLANADFYPKGLQQDFSTHGYYGTLSHNLRGVYNFYLGFYDSNPATLNPLPRQEQGKRYVEAMGGAKAVLAKMRKAIEAGDYRWATEMGSHLVFAEPGNRAARLLQADALEQLGYQAESGVWRNQYLTAAKELRATGPLPASPLSVEMLAKLPLESVFDILSVRLDHQKMDGAKASINLHISDTKEDFALELSNAVLNNAPGRKLAKADVSLSLPRQALFGLLLGKLQLQQAVDAGIVKVEGDPRALAKVFGGLREFDPAFNIVTPAVNVPNSLGQP
ncbi:alkyl/aryl-sulfatase [Pseudoduganella sp. OTU4001]|uniref:alkyl/aryl-sulfatase n=1 Tax=Pseudoduganella sp. OTU4001 TaxID=3043854 RepID=UPI00313AA4BD